MHVLNCVELIFFGQIYFFSKSFCMFWPQIFKRQSRISPPGGGFYKVCQNLTFGGKKISCLTVQINERETWNDITWKWNNMNNIKIIISSLIYTVDASFLLYRLDKISKEHTKITVWSSFQNVPSGFDTGNGHWIFCALLVQSFWYSVLQLLTATV